MTKPTISLKKTVSLFLQEWPFPVISAYQLGITLFSAYNEKKYKNNPIQLLELPFDKDEYSTLIDQCLDDGIINQHKDFPSRSVFSIRGRVNSSAEEIVCTINPYAYISHLSAMDYHGLTDRNPTTSYISAPSPGKWKKFALSKMKKDLGDYYQDYISSGFPRLQNIVLKKINKKVIHTYSSLHLGAYKIVKNNTIRVSPIGKTFLDMLREPDLCDGLLHVLDVFEEHAQRYFNLIADEIDRHGKPIDKVRAGYILSELLEMNDPKIDDWKQFAQRGGSRKLDPSEEYSTDYSETWCLSINTLWKRHG